MIDLLFQDLDKDMTEGKTGGEHAQANFETLMADLAAKRSLDTKSLTLKQLAKAGLEGDVADGKIYPVGDRTSGVAVANLTQVTPDSCNVCECNVE